MGNSALALFGICRLAAEASAALLLSRVVGSMIGCAVIWERSGNKGFACSTLLVDGSVLKLGRGDDGGSLSDEASLLIFGGKTFVLLASGIGRGSLSGLVSKS